MAVVSFINSSWFVSGEFPKNKALLKKKTEEREEEEE